MLQKQGVASEDLGAPREFHLLQANVRNYYMQFEEAQTQMMIDNKLSEYEQRARMGMPGQVRRPQGCT